MYERFTDRARKVMHLADREARRLGHGSIRGEHVLLGLIREGSGVAANALAKLKIDTTTVEAAVVNELGGMTVEPKPLPEEPSRPKGFWGKLWEALRPPPPRLPLDPALPGIVTCAIEEARQLGHNYVGTEHLLLALAADPSSAAARVLAAQGADHERVRAAVMKLLG